MPFTPSALATDISPRFPVTATDLGATHRRMIGKGNTLYQFTRYDDGELRVVAASRWDGPSLRWVNAHLWVSYQPK